MRTLFQFVIRFTLMVCLVNAAVAQDNGPANTRKTSLTVTGSTSGDRVRFTAPSSVVQIRLEVYDSTGKKLFDNEVRGGNVLDWQLKDGQAEPLADETYLCAITVKSLAGKITQRIGSVTIVKGVASVQAVDASQMTAQQTQAVGPLEENASMTVLKEGETQTATVIAHNGEEGQVTRGRGALSFRMGDFYGGKDTEQMRLTPEGNLGIGITHPQARLDVDGLIRTSQGILFADGTIQTTAAGSASGGGATAGGTGLGIGKLFKGTNQVASSGTDGNGKKKFKPELVVNEDLTVNGNIIFTSALNRDITMTQNIGGIRIFAGPTLTPNSPSSAAIQFFGNGHAGFPGQAFIDSGANNSAAVIFRTAQTGGTIAERMRVTATGNVVIGTTTPIAKLSVVESGNHALYAKSDFIGVWGDSSTSTGVYGSSGASSGTTYGVQGQSQSSTGAGVYGRNDKSHGVEGFSTNGTGVAGFNNSLYGAVFGGNSGSGPGVYGQTASKTFNQAGVFGEATASSDHVVGVYGKALNDPNGTGVAGFGQATGGYFSGTGVGVFGIGETGVSGQSTTGTGVMGAGQVGVSGFGHTGGFGGFFQNVDGEIALFVQGTGRVNVLQIVGGSDVAEHFDVVKGAKPGLVVAIDPNHPGQLSIVRSAYNRRVAGVISGANKLDAGMVLSDLPGSKNSLPVALSGRVWVYCDATRSAIHPGDLLTTSNIPGHAMKVTKHAKAQGAIIGKAMTGLKEGKGLVLVLVTLQ